MKFLTNKYTSWYNKIIYRAQRRPELNTYFENHHIIPKSLGGTNNSDNLVKLTAREHFICHILLTKMTIGQANKKMIYAAIGMKRSRKYQNRYINSRLYESIKKEFAILSKIQNTGFKQSDATRLNMSLASKGKPKTKTHAKNIANALRGIKRGPMSNSEKLKRSLALRGRQSPNKGNKFKLTLEQRAKISESNKRRRLSNETKAKISASLKARNLLVSI